MKKKFCNMLWFGICFSGMAFGQIRTNLQIVAKPDNDLVSVLQKNGIEFKRFDNARKAISNAPEGSGLMILADYYPDLLTVIDPLMFAAASRKNLRLYIEYPGWLPNMKVEKPAFIGVGIYGAVVERTVVSSDVFGPKLPKMSIMEMKDCYYVPVEAKVSMDALKIL